MHRARNSHRIFIPRLLLESSLQKNWREQTMLDIVFLALGVGLFALSIGYAYACDRL